MAWLILTMPNQTVKHVLKAKKIKLPQMNFLLEKQLIKPIAPFHSVIFLKNSYGQSRVIRMCHFRAQNGPFVMNKYFLVQTVIAIFIYLLAIFIVKFFLKILTADPELLECAILGPKLSICPKQKRFWKILNIILIYLLATFTVQNFKKILPADPEL